MIAPDTKVLVLDLDSEESRSDTIENIYNSYAHLATNGCIDFEKHGLMITDWTGWTKVNRIEKQPGSDKYWYRVKSEEGISIDVDSSQLIPLYSQYDSRVGFHGEVLYNFTPINIDLDPYMIKLTSDLYPKRIESDNKVIIKWDKESWPMGDPGGEQFIRIRHIEDDSGIIKQFSPSTFEIISERVYGYSIYTKSQFFNANGIHLLGCDRDQIKKEYK